MKKKELKEYQYVFKTKTTKKKQIPTPPKKENIEIEKTLTDQKPLLSKENNIETDIVTKFSDDTQHASNTAAATINTADELSKSDKIEKQTTNDLTISELHVTDTPDISADQITEMMILKMDEILSSAKTEKEKKKSDGLVDCGIWDFAGQKDYYATHQTFFTPHAIYILVVDIADDIKPTTHNEDDCNCIEGKLIAIV